MFPRNNMVHDWHCSWHLERIGAIMRINAKALHKMGYEVHIDEHEGIVEIYPIDNKDITEDLQALTDLSRRDCYMLMEDIHNMQIIDAIKRAS